MRRLERHQNRQQRTTIFVVLAILILVLFFIFTVGIKLLLNASVFIANLTSKKQTVSLNKNNDVVGTINIDNIYTATNSSKIVVGGSVLNFDTIEFYLNGEKVKETTLTSSDFFNEEIGDLQKGNNEVYVIGKIKNSQTKKQSKTFTVLYKSDKPKLEITEPSDNFKTSKTEIKIKGGTDRETFVKINDLPAVVDARGNFEMVIRLTSGENKITISATDIAGNTETKELKVTYEKEE